MKIGLNKTKAKRAGEEKALEKRSGSKFSFSCQEKSGFTLVEIIVILFIVSVGLIGVLSLVIQNIQSQVINKNDIIANQLAQEGVELIRKTRDSNWLNSNPWDTNLADGTYYMSYTDTIPSILVSDSDADLYQADSGYYSHNSSGTVTSFNRKLRITSIDADSMQVEAIVTWTSRQQAHEYILQAYLYDWY